MATKLAPGTFFGQTQRTLEVAGLTFAESVYPANIHIPLHVHEEAFFYLVIEGVYDEACGRETRSGGPSSLVFHPAGEPHANRWHDSGGRVFHIEISRARADAIREHGPCLDRPADFRGGVAPWLAGRLYREYRRPDGASTLAMEGLVLEILAEAARRPVAVAERASPRPGSAGCARAAPRSICGEIVARRDRRGRRCPPRAPRPRLPPASRLHPGRLLRRLRVEFACRRLASTDIPLVEIALMAGFPDQSHFTKTFRHQMRMTPGEFRRHFRALG